MNIVYAAAPTAIAAPDGGIHTLVPGEPWAADDPLVKAHPECFSSEPKRVKTSGRGWTPVEQMTAAPGEKRTTKR